MALFAVLAVVVTTLLTASAHWPGTAHPPVVTRLAKPVRPAPAATAPVGPVSGTHMMSVDGVARTYRSIVPGRITGRVPLLIVLHGRGQSARGAMRDTGFLALAEQRRAVLVYPDGQHRSWDAGHGCCGFAGTRDTPDVAFVTALVADAERRWPIDAGRVYLVGYSNGGKLAYTTLCAHPSLFAAVATYGAVPLAQCGPGTPPVPVLLAAGTADRVMPFQGKPSGNPPLPSVPQALEWLRAQDGCPAAAPTSRAGSAEIQRWVGCRNKTEVESVFYTGRGHPWPNAQGKAASPAVAGVMWTFFSQQGEQPFHPPTRG
ncbi:MAG: alpha/beta hydrolase family esterase [Pseudonocardiaceae bacterium]